MSTIKSFDQLPVTRMTLPVTSIFRHLSSDELDAPPAKFVGKLCRVAFLAPDATPERLWLLCYGVADDKATLLGTVNVTPSKLRNVKQGDNVRFMRAEILDTKEMDR